MQRWATHLFIAGYLTALGFGLAAHAFTCLKTCHPGMYFLVWDMFCGWSAYETRMHVVGEGDSGTMYELAPAPWGSFVPYGSAQRQDYDVFGQYGYRLASNVLAHTEHEPIRRIMVVEESWPKKFNLPGELWELRYQTEKPAEPRSYFQVRRTYSAVGVCLHERNSWLNTQFEMCVLDNPRLRTDMRKGHTFFATNPGDRSASAIQPVGFNSVVQ
jgi:hypothetical protein